MRSLSLNFTGRHKSSYLAEKLRLNQVALCDIFTGSPIRTAWGRLFGGQAVAQSMLAACATVKPHLHVHSMHGYFLLAGTVDLEILFEVDRVRDGRSFATRSVKALQQGRCIFQLMVSFHVDEEGPSFQIPFHDLRASLVAKHIISPTDRGVPTAEELIALGGDTSNHSHSSWISVVTVSEGDRWNLRWCRYNENMGGNSARNTHCAILAYMSDMSLVSTVRKPHIANGHEFTMSMSLDHTVHFHRPFSVDSWLLFHTETTTSSGSRGLANTLVFDVKGNLVVSIMQEALIRVARM